MDHAEILMDYRVRRERERERPERCAGIPSKDKFCPGHPVSIFANGSKRIKEVVCSDERSLGVVL